MNQTFNQSEYINARFAPRNPVRNDSFKGPRFEGGFSPEQERYLKKAFKLLDPANKIMPGITKVVFDPSWPTVAGFVPDYKTGTATIIIGRVSRSDSESDLYPAGTFSTEGQFLYYLGHEMQHYVTDVKLHIKRNADGSPILDKHKRPMLTKHGERLYGNLKNAMHIEKVVIRTTLQALDTETFLNDYQKKLGYAYTTLDGLIRTRMGLVDYYMRQAEEARAKADAEPTKGNLERADIAEREAEDALLGFQQTIIEQGDTGFALVQEGFTEMMSDQISNHKSLRDNSKLQQDAWETKRRGSAHRRFGTGKDIAFMDPYLETRRILLRVWGFDDGIGIIKPVALSRLALHRAKLNDFAQRYNIPDFISKEEFQERQAQAAA